MLFEQLEKRHLLATIVWDGEAGNGDWHTAANWFDQTNQLNNVLPGASDDVVIPDAVASTSRVTSSNNVTVKSLTSDEDFRVNGGTFFATESSSLAHFQLNGGFIDGGGTLTVHTFQWNDGRIKHDEFVVTGSLDLESLVDPRIESDGKLTLAAGATGVWSGGHFRNAGFFEIAGSFDIQTDSDLFSGGAIHVVSGGSIVKSAGSSTTLIESRFTNDGTVNINAGTLMFLLGNTPGEQDNGVYSVAENAVLRFNGGSGAEARTIAADAQIIGAGGLTLSAGGFRDTHIHATTFTLTGPVRNFAGTTHFHSDITINDLTLAGGFIDGAGTLQANTFTWNDGRIRHPDLIVTNLLDLSSTLDPRIEPSGKLTLSLGATGAWTGEKLRNAGVFEIGGDMNLQTNSRLSGAGTVHVVPGGKLNKSGGGGQQIDNVILQQGGFGIAEGQSLTLIRSFTQTGGSSAINGNLNLSEPLLLQAGNLEGTGTIIGNVNNSGGSIRPGVSGPGGFTINGDFSQSLPGALEIELSGTAPGSEFDQLNILGTATIGGALNVVSNTSLSPGNSFEFLTATAVQGGFDQNNAAASGLEIQQTATSVTLFAPAAMDVLWISESDGVWEDPSNWNTGSVPRPEDRAVIDIPNADPVITITSDRTVTAVLNNETISIAADVQWPGGTWNGSGQFVIEANGELELASVDPKSLVDVTVQNAGTLVWSDGDVDATGSSIINRGTFEIQSGADLKGSIQILNENLIRQSLGNASMTFTDTLVNDRGVIDVSSGTLTFKATVGAIENAGQVKVNAAAKLILEGLLDLRNDGDISVAAAGELRLKQGQLLNRDLGHVQSSGSLQLESNLPLINHGTIDLSVGSSLFNTGLLQNHGSLDVDSGLLTVDGQIVNTGEINVNGLLTSGNVTNAGNIQMVGGVLTANQYTQSGDSLPILTEFHNGTLSLTSGDMVIEKGVVRGKGSIIGNVLNSGGTFFLNDVISVDGSYVQAVGGGLSATLGGLSEPARLEVSDGATIAGRVNVSVGPQALPTNYAIVDVPAGAAVTIDDAILYQEFITPPFSAQRIPDSDLVFLVGQSPIGDISIDVPGVIRIEMSDFAVGANGLVPGDTNVELTALQTIQDVSFDVEGVVLRNGQLAIDDLTFFFDTILPDIGVAVRDVAISFRDFVIDFAGNLASQASFVVQSLSDALQQTKDHLLLTSEYLSEGLRAVFGTSNAAVYDDGSCDSGIPGVCGIELNFDSLGNLTFDPKRPFRLGPLEATGQLQFDHIEIQSNEGPVKTWIGRSIGFSTDQIIGVETELIYSPFGPLLGTVTSSNAIPVGELIGAFGAQGGSGGLAANSGSLVQQQYAKQSGLVMTGMKGGLVFNSPPKSFDTATDLLASEQLAYPLDISEQQIHNKLSSLILESNGSLRNEPITTWETDFGLVVSGGLSHINLPAIIGSHVTLGANISNPFSPAAPADPEPGFQLFGHGSLEIFGQSLSDMGLLITFDDDLIPSLNAAVDLQLATQEKNELLQQLVPASGIVEFELDTTGMLEGTVIGMGKFFNSLNETAEPIFRSLADELLDNVASQLESNHDHPLAQLVLDVVAPTAEIVVDDLEDRAVITVEFLKQRLSELLDVAETELQAVVNDPDVSQAIIDQANRAAIAGNLMLQQMMSAPKHSALAMRAILQQAAGGPAAFIQFARTTANSLADQTSQLQPIIESHQPLIHQIRDAADVSDVAPAVIQQLNQITEDNAELLGSWEIVKELALQASTTTAEQIQELPRRAVAIEKQLMLYGRQVEQSIALAIAANVETDAGAKEQKQNRLVEALESALATVTVIPARMLELSVAIIARTQLDAPIQSATKAFHSRTPAIGSALDQSTAFLIDVLNVLQFNLDQNAQLQAIESALPPPSTLSEMASALQQVLASVQGNPIYAGTTIFIDSAIQNSGALTTGIETIRSTIDQFNAGGVTAENAVTAIVVAAETSVPILPALTSDVARLAAELAKIDLTATAVSIAQFSADQLPRIVELEASLRESVIALAQQLSESAIELTPQIVSRAAQAAELARELPIEIAKLAAHLSVDSLYPTAFNAAQTAFSFAASIDSQIQRLALNMSQTSEGDPALPGLISLWLEQLIQLDETFDNYAVEAGIVIAEFASTAPTASVIAAQDALASLASHLQQSGGAALRHLLEQSGYRGPVTSPSLTAHLKYLELTLSDRWNSILEEVVAFVADQPGITVAQQHLPTIFDPQQLSPDQDYWFLEDVASLTQDRLASLEGVTPQDIEASLSSSDAVLNRSFLIAAAIGLAPIAAPIAGAVPIGQALLDAAPAFFETINPSLSIRGDVAPVLLGMPINPIGDVVATISKNELRFGGTVSLLQPLGELTPLPLPLTDEVELEASFDFINLFQDLALAVIPRVDFTEGWYGTFDGTVDVLGVELGAVEGAVFSASTGNLPDNHPLIQQLQQADLKTNYDQLRAELIDTGGILLSGGLRLPSFLTNPFQWFAGLPTFIAGCTQDPVACVEQGLEAIELETVGDVQIFVPNVPEKLLNLVLEASNQGGEIVGRSSDHIADQIRAILGLPAVVAAPGELFTDVDTDKKNQAIAETQTATDFSGDYNSPTQQQLVGLDFSGAEIRARALVDEFDAYFSRLAGQFQDATAQTNTAKTSFNSAGASFNLIFQELTSARNNLASLIPNTGPLDSAIAVVQQTIATSIPSAQSAVNAASAGVDAMATALIEAATEIPVLRSQAFEVVNSVVAAVSEITSIAGTAGPLGAIEDAIEFLQDQLGNIQTAPIAASAIPGLATNYGIALGQLQVAAGLLHSTRSKAEILGSELSSPLIDTLSVSKQVNGQTLEIPIDLSGVLPRVGIAFEINNNDALATLGAPPIVSQSNQWIDDAAGTGEVIDATLQFQLYSPGYDLESDDRIQQLGGIGIKRLDEITLENLFGEIYGEAGFHVTPAGIGGEFFGYGELDLFDVVSFPVGSADNPLIHGMISESGCIQFTANLPGLGEEAFFFGLAPNACAPQLFVDDVTVLEGTDLEGTDPEPTVISIPIRVEQVPPLSGNEKIRLDYVLIDGTGEGDAVARSDFAPDNSPLTGSIELTESDLDEQTSTLRGFIDVEIIGDSDLEFDESFDVKLFVSLLENIDLIVADSVATITILDDDFVIPERPAAPLLYDFESIVSFGKSTFPSRAPASDSTLTAENFTSFPNDGFVIAPGLPEFDDDIGVAAKSNSATTEYFEFTINPGVNFVPRRIEFWDRPNEGDAWQLQATVGTSGRVTIPVEELVTVTSESIPSAVTQLHGWRKHRAEIGRSLCDLQLFPDANSPVPQIVPCFNQAVPVTFRLTPTQLNGSAPHQRTIDSIALFGGDDVQFGTFFEDTILLETLLHGEMQITIDGSGMIQVLRDPSSGVTDPIESGELSIQVIGADATTTVTVSLEVPAGTNGDDIFEFASFTSDSAFALLDLSGIANVAGHFLLEGPVDQLLFDSIADGTVFDIAGTPQDQIEWIANGSIGQGGAGVEIIFPGQISATAAAWNLGSITAGSIGDISTLAGDFSPDVLLQQGFGTINVSGGDFASSQFSTGLGEAENDGAGTAINVNSSDGSGGALKSPRIEIDGNLTQIQTIGGPISTSLTARAVGSIVATTSPNRDSEADIRGSFVTESIDEVKARGGDIEASVTTTDPNHTQFRAVAEQDESGSGGKIQSPRSFHIAGGVQEISADEIVLSLLTDSFVQSIVGGNASVPGNVEVSLRARQVGTIHVVGHARIAIRTTGTEAELGNDPAVELIQVQGGSYLGDIRTQPGTLSGPVVVASQLDASVPGMPLRFEVEQFGTATESASINWGDGTVDSLGLDNSNTAHIYSDTGTYAVTVELTNALLNTTTISQSVIVDHVLQRTDPVSPGRQTVFFGGSSLADTMEFVAGTVAGSLQLRLNQQELGSFDPTTLSDVVAFGSDSNDQFVLHTNLVPMIDGQDGNDVVRIGFDGLHLQLHSTHADRFRNIEALDLSGLGPAALSLNAIGVIDSTEDSNHLLVTQASDDLVSYIGDGWTVEPPIFVDNSQRHVLVNGEARVETINTRPWQNPLMATDVNRSGDTTALDALQIINYMGRFEPGTILLPDPTGPGELPERYYDVDGGGTASALDALRVINFMARQNASAEPELVEWQSPAAVAAKNTTGGVAQTSTQTEIETLEVVDKIADFAESIDQLEAIDRIWAETDVIQERANRTLDSALAEIAVELDIGLE